MPYRQTLTVIRDKRWFHKFRPDHRFPVSHSYSSREQMPLTDLWFSCLLQVLRQLLICFCLSEELLPGDDPELLFSFFLLHRQEPETSALMCKALPKWLLTWDHYQFYNLPTRHFCPEELEHEASPDS